MAQTSAQQLAEYERLMKEVSAKAAGKSGFAADLEKALKEKTNYNRDLIDEKNRLQEETFDLPSQLRMEMLGGAVRNPLEQERLISGRRTNVGSRLGSVIDSLNERGQRTSDILSKALQGYDAEMAGLQASAQGALTLAQMLQAREEAEKARAAARASAGGFAGFGGINTKKLSKINFPTAAGGQSSSGKSTTNLLRRNYGTAFDKFMAKIPGLKTIGEGIADGDKKQIARGLINPRVAPIAQGLASKIKSWF